MKVLIIGGGQVGSHLAHMLLENNCSVRIIEQTENVLSKLREALPDECVVHGNGTDPTLLETAGIADADVVAAVTGADEANLMTATMAKFEFGVPRVIARVNNPKNAWLFNSSMGVDVGINQADLMSHLIIEEINYKNMMTLMKISRGNYAIVQIQVDSKSASVNKKIKELEMPKKALLIAIYRDEDLIIPHGETTVETADVIMAFADDDAQETLNQLFG